MGDLRILVYLVVYDSGRVSLEHLLLSRYLPDIWLYNYMYSRLVPGKGCTGNCIACTCIINAGFAAALIGTLAVRPSEPRRPAEARPGFPPPQPGQREFCIDNLLVRIHFIIEIIWWTGVSHGSLNSFSQVALYLPS